MVHKYRQSGFNIVMDVESGAVHLVDDPAYRLLDCVNEFTIGKSFDELELGNLLNVYDTESLKGAYRELVALHNRGVLFSRGSSVDRK